MATFWAMFGKFGLLFIPISGHTDYSSSGAWPTVCISTVFIQALALITGCLRRQGTCEQCVQIGQFIGLWATFLKPLATINLPKSPTFLDIFVKVSKAVLFLVKSFLGNFNRLLAIFFWSHCLWVDILTTSYGLCHPLSPSIDKALVYTRLNPISSKDISTPNYLLLFYKNGQTPASFWFIFGLFKQTIQF